jgi:hypothetical protein
MPSDMATRRDTLDGLLVAYRETSLTRRLDLPDTAIASALASSVAALDRVIDSNTFRTYPSRYPVTKFPE